MRLTLSDECPLSLKFYFASEHSEFAEGSNAPTLHVLFHRQLPKTILTRPYPSMTYTLAVREAFISWLANEALGGDHDAAEWVLLSCISSV